MLATDWIEDFENGIRLYNTHDESMIANAIKRLRVSFNKGLCVASDSECYFQAAKTLSMLYFEQCKYQQVINHLYPVIHNASEKEIPDWAWLYYALSIFNAHISLVAFDPQEFFFKYTDKVSTNNSLEIKRRAGICQEMLEGLVNVYADSHEINKNIANIILDKICEYGIKDTDEISLFIDTFIPEYRRHTVESFLKQKTTETANVVEEAPSVEIYEVLRGHELIMAKIGRNKRIAIITDHRFKWDDLLKTAYDMNFEEEDFKRYDDFEKNKHKALPTKFGDNIFAIIAACGAHKLPNMTKSYICNLQTKYNGEKIIVEARSNGGRHGVLKLTKDSFKNALLRIERDIIRNNNNRFG